MSAAHVMIQALDALFIAGAVFSLVAIGKTWASVRDQVRSLRADAAERDRSVAFSYTLITTERTASRNVRTVLPIRRQAVPARPALRAAA